jgi:hypothetical protein
VDVSTGKWTAVDFGIGGGVDSYFEYLVNPAHAYSCYRSTVKILLFIGTNFPVFYKIHAEILLKVGMKHQSINQSIIEL